MIINRPGDKLEKPQDIKSDNFIVHSQISQRCF